MEAAGAIARVLVVVAHPDDAEFAAGGTIAKWTRSNIEVSYCVVTNGDASEMVPGGAAEASALRRTEQRAAADVLGVSSITFLGYPDGILEPSLALRRDIAREIRRTRPDRVLTYSPNFNFTNIGQSHPDHRAVGTATLDAIYPDARNPRAFPELISRDGLAPWAVESVWLRAPQPLRDCTVDITDTFDAKVAALRAHASQTGHLRDLAGLLRTRMSRNALDGGLGHDRLAERFQTITI